MRLQDAVEQVREILGAETYFTVGCDVTWRAASRTWESKWSLYTEGHRWSGLTSLEAVLHRATEYRRETLGGIEGVEA